MSEERDGVIYLTAEEWIAQRDADLSKTGLTWEQLESFVDDCRCCITLPAEYEHLNDEYLRQIWWTYR